MKNNSQEHIKQAREDKLHKAKSAAGVSTGSETVTRNHAKAGYLPRRRRRSKYVTQILKDSTIMTA